MMNITKNIICTGLFLFAFHLSADVKETKQNEINKDQKTSNSVAIHFGPGPNLTEGPKGETRSIKKETNNENSNKQQINVKK